MTLWRHSRPLRDALEESASRLRRYHHHQITTSWQYTDEYGNILGERVSPLARAAVYVPGGKASYPSSAGADGFNTGQSRRRQ